MSTNIFIFGFFFPVKYFGLFWSKCRKFPSKSVRVAFTTNSALNPSAFVLRAHYSPRLLTNPARLRSVRKPPHTPAAEFADETLQQRATLSEV